MKPVVAIFAHPDDEAFGPSGMLAKFAKERDVYIICATDGAAGMNSSAKTEDLAQIRKEELLASAKVLGVKEVFFLGFKDGTLSNNMYHEIADKLKVQLEKLDPEILLTHELRGESGHIDHIAVAFVTTYVFERESTASELWYYCISEERRERLKDYFIYFPPGYKKEDIDKRVDVSAIWEVKTAAMHKHASQLHDIERVLKSYEGMPKEENFIILKK